ATGERDCHTKLLDIAALAIFVFGHTRSGGNGGPAIGQEIRPGILPLCRPDWPILAPALATRSLMGGQLTSAPYLVSLCRNRQFHEIAFRIRSSDCQPPAIRCQSATISPLRKSVAMQSVAGYSVPDHHQPIRICRN